MLYFIIQPFYLITISPLWIGGRQRHQKQLLQLPKLPLVLPPGKRGHSPAEKEERWSGLEEESRHLLVEVEDKGDTEKGKEDVRPGKYLDGHHLASAEPGHRLLSCRTSLTSLCFRFDWMKMLQSAHLLFCPTQIIMSKSKSASVCTPAQHVIGQCCFAQPCKSKSALQLNM